MKKEEGNLNLPAKDLPSEPEPNDFRRSMGWRVFRIMSEFVEGFEFIANYKKSVTIFGSTRHSSATHKWYEEARELGRLLAKKGFAVVTGGGPGIMEAANRGASEAGGGYSIGLNIQLPREQRVNPYVDQSVGFHYFFTRKLMLTYSAQVYVYFPGGFGTLDEFFEILTLIQTKKIETHIPIVLVGREFWEPFDAWIKEEVLGHHGAIEPEDRKLYTIVDSAKEAMAIVRKSKPRKAL